jgi:hypothetical protein
LNATSIPGTCGSRESRVVTIGGKDYTFTEPSWADADLALFLALTIMERADEFTASHAAAIKTALADYAEAGGDVSNVDAMHADNAFLLLVATHAMSAIRGHAAGLIGNLSRHASEVTELLALVTGEAPESFANLSRDTIGKLVNEAVGTLPFGSAMDSLSNLISTYIVGLHSKSDEADEKQPASAPVSDGGRSILAGMECASPEASSQPPNAETPTS